METYFVNGKELQYDTFEAANIELYLSEVRRISGGAKAVQASGADVVPAIREQCFSVMDFFDTVLGEGTAAALFGGSVNIRAVTQAFKEFTEAVNRNMTELANTISDGAGAAVQRPEPVRYAPSAGAANREQRRREARERAAKKAVTPVEA